MIMFQRLKKLLSSENHRSDNLKKNVVASFGIKGINILTSLLLIPITIDYVNPTQYGIWLTLSSIITWISYFDFGLSLGFKNRFAEAKAMNDIPLAKQYVSTTYALMALIFIPFCLVLLVVNHFLDWPSIIKVSASYREELRRVFEILIIFFSADMIVKTLFTLLDADQQPALSAAIRTSGQVITLIIIYVMTLTTKGSLINLSFIYSAIPVLVLIIASIIVFKNKHYSEFTPLFKNIRLKLTGKILSLGWQFFVIMLSMLLIFQLINILIARNLGPEVVTEYNVAYKYFSAVLMVVMIILNPYWAAFTDAYTLEDKHWMKKSLSQLEKMCLICIPLFILMLIISPWVYKIWVGEKVQIPFISSLMIAFFTFAQTLSSVYTYIINGIGKVRLQTIIYVTFAIIAVPIMNYASQRYGIVGLLSIPTLTYLAQAFACKIQVGKLIDNQAKGIWKK